MISVQEPIDQKFSTSMESVVKKLYAQPLNGNSTINISSSGGTQIRVEIPACLNKIDDMEISYTLNCVIPGKVILANVANTQMNMTYGIHATHETLFQRVECYMATSTNKFVDLTNATHYFREVSSLKNDFKKRNLSQRFNFSRDLELEKTNTKVPLQPFDYVDGYHDANVDVESYSKTTVKQNTVISQQQYIPLNTVDYTVQANVDVTFSYPTSSYKFTYKLKDLLPDSIFAKYKFLPHKSNLVLIFWLNSIGQIVTVINKTVTTVANDATPSFIGSKTGSININDLSISLTNFFVKYYAETNTNIIQAMMQSEIQWVYPFIYQSNISASGTQNGVNLILGDEGANRLYRIYTALFASGTYTRGRDTLYNCQNYKYEKWDGNVELYINNDLIMRILPGSNVGDIDDWKEYFSRYKDSSLNSGREIEHHGCLVFDFDSDTKNGSKKEYDDNTLKGMMLNKQVNINPRFINVKVADGISVYNQYIFAVVLRQCIIKNGEMIIF